MTATPYALRGIKSFPGSQGDGFSATLQRAGKKVATVRDEGNGSLFLNFDWVSPAAEAAFVLHCARQPHRTVLGQREPPSPDDVILRMVDKHEFIASMKRQLKKFLVVVTEGTLRIQKLKRGYRPTSALILAYGQKFPEHTLLNALPLEEALEQAWAVELAQSEQRMAVADTLALTICSPQALGASLVA